MDELLGVPPRSSRCAVGASGRQTASPAGLSTRGSLSSEVFRVSLTGLSYSSIVVDPRGIEPLHTCVQNRRFPIQPEAQRVQHRSVYLRILAGCNPACC